MKSLKEKIYDLVWGNIRPRSYGDGDYGVDGRDKTVEKLHRLFQRELRKQRDAD